MLLIRQLAKLLEHLQLSLCSRGRQIFRYNFPRMTAQHSRKPDEPFDGQLPFGKFEVAYLLVGRPNPRRYLSQSEASSFAERLEPITQNRRPIGLIRPKPAKAL